MRPFAFAMSVLILASLAVLLTPHQAEPFAGHEQSSITPADLIPASLPEAGLYDSF